MPKNVADDLASEDKDKEVLEDEDLSQSKGGNHKYKTQIGKNKKECKIIDKSEPAKKNIKMMSRPPRNIDIIQHRLRKWKKVAKTMMMCHT